MTFYFELCNPAYSRGEGFEREISSVGMSRMLKTGEATVNKGKVIMKDVNQYNEPCICIIDYDEVANEYRKETKK